MLEEVKDCRFWGGKVEAEGGQLDRVLTVVVEIE